MRTSVLIAAALLVAVLVIAPRARAQAATSWVTIATWMNDPAHEAAGARVEAELRRAGIETVATCLGSCVLHVHPPDASRARAIVAAVIAREHLDVHLEP